MMKKLCTYLTAFGTFIMAELAGAATLNLLPQTLTVTAGDSMHLDLVIDGLSDFAPVSLGAFTVDIAYDPSLFSFQSYSLGLNLGDPLLDAIDLSSGEYSVGSIGLSEISLLSATELDAIQPASFILASLEFSVDALLSDVTTSITIDPFAMLSDAAGNSLALDGMTNALVSLTDSKVSEPNLLFLMGLGLVGLGFARKYGSTRRVNCR